MFFLLKDKYIFSVLKSHMCVCRCAHVHICTLITALSQLPTLRFYEIAFNTLESMCGMILLFWIKGNLRIIWLDIQHRKLMQSNLMNVQQPYQNNYVRKMSVLFNGITMNESKTHILNIVLGFQIFLNYFFKKCIFQESRFSFER